MSEAELLSEIGINVERYWNMVQWWASVTFAVLLASHLGAKQLNWVFTAVIVVLYTLFSVTIAQVINQYLNQMFAAVLALEALSGKQELSLAGVDMLNSSSANIGISLWITLIVTFVATLFYVIYSYRTQGKGDVQQTGTETGA